MTKLFCESVQESVAHRGHHATAASLKLMGFSFEKAYELIFNKAPRKWDVLEHMKMLIKADKEAEARANDQYPKE